MDLFAQDRKNSKAQPLAARMRPSSLDDIVGQDHILAGSKLLRRAIEADRLGSIILYGPPGCGKTSLAEVIASATSRRFERASGAISNVATLRKIIESADYLQRQDGTETILFIDEIHRFNKAQQDILLPHVEEGTITLIGATTHNPMFFINSPLNSRSQLFELAPLSSDALTIILTRAVESEQGLASAKVSVDEDAIAHLANICEGDARRALNALEIAALTVPPDTDGRRRVTRVVAEESVQKKAILYDHDEDGHYDTISAFIKSIRGSDPHAALYWLAKMLYAGEDPRFVARRLVILASEDIGNADPRGLTLATSAMHAVEFVGMPEAQLILAQATTYLATAPKSNASYIGIKSATEDVKNGVSLPVPEHLKNVHAGAHAAASPSAGKNSDYVYPHDFDGHHVNQEYAPTDARYYMPSGEGYEDVIKKRMAHWQQAQKKGGPHD